MLLNLNIWVFTSVMISVELLKSYCFTFLFFAVDAISSNIRILENCVNRALFRIFGSCDKNSGAVETTQISVLDFMI